MLTRLASTVAVLDNLNTQKFTTLRPTGCSEPGVISPREQQRTTKLLGGPGPLANSPRLPVRGWALIELTKGRSARGLRGTSGAMAAVMVPARTVRGRVIPGSNPVGPPALVTRPGGRFFPGGPASPFAGARLLIPLGHVRVRSLGRVGLKGAHRPGRLRGRTMTRRGDHALLGPGV
jgi:hypothetical protein